MKSVFVSAILIFVLFLCAISNADAQKRKVNKPKQPSKQIPTKTVPPQPVTPTPAIERFTDQQKRELMARVMNGPTKSVRSSYLLGNYSKHLDLWGVALTHFSVDEKGLFVHQGSQIARVDSLWDGVILNEGLSQKLMARVPLIDQASLDQWSEALRKVAINYDVRFRRLSPDFSYQNETGKTWGWEGIAWETRSDKSSVRDKRLWTLLLLLQQDRLFDGLRFNVAESSRLLSRLMTITQEAVFTWLLIGSFESSGDSAMSLLNFDELFVSEVFQMDRYNRKRNAAKEFIVGILLNQLNSSNSDARYIAIDKLGLLQATSAVEPLIAALKDKDLGIRKSAAWSLGFIGDVRAIEPLALLANDHSSYDSDRFAYTLSQIDDPRAVEALGSLLKTADKDTRFQIVGFMRRIKDPRAVDFLIEALADPNSSVRLSASDELGRKDLAELKNRRTGEILINALSNPQLYSRGVPSLLAKLMDPRAILPLIVAMERDEKMGFPRSSLESHFYEFWRALKELTGQKFDTAKEWRQWWEQNKEKYEKK